MRKVFARHLGPFQEAFQHSYTTFGLARLPTRAYCSIIKAPLCVRTPFAKLGFHSSFVPRQYGGSELSTNLIHTSSEGSKVAAIDLAQIFACPGCGALAQSVEHGRPGYYTMKRAKVIDFLKMQRDPKKSQLEGSETVSGELGHDSKLMGNQQKLASNIPVCDRCHELTYHNVRMSVPNPTIDSINDILDSSPWKYNHIIHVIDAADFPLSAVRGIQELLNASPQRSHNRRARTKRFAHDRATDLSFVITRSDLLAPKKELVDNLMPTLVRILERHLGLGGQRKRFGNVRCVSSTRGWWTPEVKAAIKAKGGAIWLVGKENVGKSALFEVIFPKGSLDTPPALEVGHSAGNSRRPRGLAQSSTQIPFNARNYTSNEDFLDPNHILLPPARQEVPYPLMPTVSEMPGTTASPIRVPFGSGMGEMIDLPGLERGDIQALVTPAHSSKLLMKRRIKNPLRYKIRPGQSLLLGGGLVRLTPLYQDAITFITPFVTVDGHQTSNEKAAQIQNGSGDIQVASILTEVAKENITSAGVFEIAQDVTKERAGPLTAPSAIGLKTKQLPFRVFATDIVIEGLGWVDVTVQVRTRDFPHARSDFQLPFPGLEVFTPYGKYVAQRETINAGHYMGPKKSPRRGRPRRSMARARKS